MVRVFLALLLAGTHNAQNAKKDAQAGPDIQVRIAARAQQADEAAHNVKAGADITAFAAVAGADGHNTRHQQADGQQQPRGAAHFPIVADGVAQPCHTGLHAHQHKQYNTENSNNQFCGFHSVFLLIPGPSAR